MGDALASRIEALETDRLDPDALAEQVREALLPSLSSGEAALETAKQALAGLAERITTGDFEDAMAAPSLLVPESAGRATRLFAQGASLGVAGAVFWWLTRRLSRSLAEVIAVARAIGNGDYRRRLHLSPGGEMAALAEAVNRMRAPGADDFEPLRRAYLAKYGPPRAVPATLEEDLVWSWPKSQIALSRDAADGGLSIRYADAALLAEVVKAETAAGAPPVISGGLRLFSRGDPPRSFRGAVFGTPLSALAGAEYLYGHRGRKYYRRPGERLNLGDIPLTSVVYAYDADRLASVTLIVAARDGDPEKDFERVLSAYATKYGPPAARGSQDGSRLFLWTWPGVSIALASPKAGPLEIHYIDASLLRRREAALAAKALDALDRKVFETPRQNPARIERAGGQE